MIEASSRLQGVEHLIDMEPIYLLSIGGMVATLFIIYGLNLISQSKKKQNKNRNRR